MDTGLKSVIANNDIITAQEVACLLRVSVKWVYSHKYEIPGYIQGISIIRFVKSTFLDWLKKTQKRID